MGGSQANDRFSKAEVAEIILYNRALFPSEVIDLENYLHRKWLGGSAKDFPLLVRLSTQSHPDFDLQSFADPAGGGDLRFYDKDNEELAYEIDEWNASGESLVWVKVPDFSESTHVFAYWGNDANTTPSSQNIWTDYEAVWHSSDTTDSTGNGRDASTEGTISFDNGGLIGKPVSFIRKSCY